MVNVKELRKKAFEEAVKILAVSMGFVASSLSLAFGVTLILGEIYMGFIPLIVGYEMARATIKFLWKHNLGKFTPL